MITVKKDKRCFCGSGKKTKNCHPNIHHKSRGAELIRLYKLLDQQTEDHFKVSNWKPPCQTGCNNCCYDDFDISQTEFDLMLHEMRTWPLEDYQAVFKVALEQLKIQIKEKPEVMKILINKFDLVMYEQLTRGKENTLKENRNSFPCPLLDEKTGKCRVYNNRPLICRSYGVSDPSISDNSDREICEYIPSRKNIKNNLFDSGSLVKKYFDIIEPYFKQIGERIIDRKRPIYLWFVAVMGKMEQEGVSHFLDDDNLMVEMRAWNEKRLHEIKQKIRKKNKSK